MRFVWLEDTKEVFENIRSYRFSEQETIQYKLNLLDRIEGSYKILVDRFIVYYSFSNNGEICFIEYFKHSSQHY